MQLSAEARWFWPSAPPVGLEDWFHSAQDASCATGDGEARLDEYLRDAAQAELGVKRRCGKGGVEVKGLVAVTAGGLAVDPFVGPIELWAKWTSEPLELKAGSTIAINKLRWLRKFDTSGSSPREVPLDKTPLPALGCNVELTRITLPGGEIWWTLGFEAFGTIRTVENDLRATATVLAARGRLSLEGGVMASYPAWLRAHAGPA